MESGTRVEPSEEDTHPPDGVSEPNHLASDGLWLEIPARPSRNDSERMSRKSGVSESGEAFVISIGYWLLAIGYRLLF